jgi:hypothetical protein
MKNKEIAILALTLFAIILNTFHASAFSGGFGIDLVIDNNESCAPNWSCDAWSLCTNSWQTRTCTDLNNCGTLDNKPEDSRTCIINNNELSDNSDNDNSINDKPKIKEKIILQNEENASNAVIYDNNPIYLNQIDNKITIAKSSTAVNLLILSSSLFLGLILIMLIKVKGGIHDF